MKKRILLGDDNEQMRSSLARAVRARGLEADLATTSEETIAKARAGNYSAVVTDLEYTEGGREGFEVLRQIRNLPGLKILYTAQSGFEFVAEGLESGADYVILKKDPLELFRVLEENLGRRK